MAHLLMQQLPLEVSMRPAHLIPSTRLLGGWVRTLERMRAGPSIDDADARNPHDGPDSPSGSISQYDQHPYH